MIKMLKSSKTKVPQGQGNKTVHKTLVGGETYVFSDAFEKQLVDDGHALLVEEDDSEVDESDQGDATE